MRLTLVLAVAVLAAANDRFEDISSFETFVPKLVSDNKENVVVAVVYQGTSYTLSLKLNRELFAPDWFLETTDAAGNVVRTTDTEPFMCHYTGVVQGVADSEVVMSLCSELGMRGTIRMPHVNLEVQHAVPLIDNNGASSRRQFHGEDHIIYDLKNVNTRDLVMDHVMPTFNDTVNGGFSAPPPNYVCNPVVASDSIRVNAFSSAAAEAQNTQAVMNQVNTRYRGTTWNVGDTLTISLGGQAQSPAGWAHSTDMNTKLNNLNTYKSNSQPTRDNVPGFTHHNYGGTVGLAWVGTMCNRANSCGVNNVGFTTSDSTRGVLVAHEMGHNFNFQHDANPNTGFVMWPSVVASASQFSTTSRSAFQNARGRFTCL